MRIAFDLDDTLIPGVVVFPVERRCFLARLLGHEQIRDGTVALMKSLVNQGWDIWIYTTSFRSPGYVRMLFRLHSVRIAGVINQALHNETVTGCGHAYQDCSKYPPAFNIHLLVDESEGVWLESQRHGFDIVLVRPDDPAWAEAVVAKARSMSER
ncbi:hypothetical protein [Singulisphaera acidiphila]|uniref:Uncharacterized protein n=1 Tax=Singulisphaera acidiphila (strain ATCC BAA-1392 / DSM 18658 / VKM B-2454 / MOB10) TaxID=886293 RepID=L0D7Q7_SINAD|nr:hypothetical protein [Singulisphaera acidiphila]AGA25287.1 hypothetical protein Sinac_0882 [Singulisphaera acidiphila DSM 18658]